MTKVSDKELMKEVKEDLKRDLDRAEKRSDIIFDSTYANINVFISNHSSAFELTNLCLYLGGMFQHRPPTEMEKEFIGEFMGHDAWATYVSRSKNPTPLFKHIPPFDLTTILSILNFETMLAVQDKMLNIDKIEKNHEKLKSNRRELKKQLKSAIDNSYYDGIFYKADGWCYVSEVLENNNLIKLEDI
jgi:hypothetical protein